MGQAVIRAVNGFIKNGLAFCGHPGWSCERLAIDEQKIFAWGGNEVGTGNSQDCNRGL